MIKISGGSIAIGVLALTVWVGVYVIYQRWVKKHSWKQTVEFSILWGMLGMVTVIVTLGLIAAVFDLFINPPPPLPIAWPPSPYGMRTGIGILAALWTLGVFVLTISGLIASVRAKGEPDDLSRQDEGEIVNSLPAFVSGAWEVGVFRGGIALAVIFLLLRSAAPHLTLEDAMLNTIGWAFLIGLMMSASMGFVWVALWGVKLIRGDEDADGETPGVFKKWLAERHRDSILSRIAADLALAYSINPETVGFVSADGLLLLPESLRDGLGLREGGELRFFRNAESGRYEIWTAGDIEQLLSDDPATGDAVLRGLEDAPAEFPARKKDVLLSRIAADLASLYPLEPEPAGYISRDGLLLVPESVREGLSISDEDGGGISFIRNKETGRYEVWTTEELDRWLSDEPVTEDEIAQLSDEPATDDDEIPF